jgi:hypothetical protein
MATIPFSNVVSWSCVSFAGDVDCDGVVAVGVAEGVGDDEVVFNDAVQPHVLIVSAAMMVAHITKANGFIFLPPLKYKTNSLQTLIQVKGFHLGAPVPGDHVY